MAYDYAVPTVVGIRVKCPECGATTQASGDVVKCQYCGTESRVQRRTMVFQQPVKLPPPLPSQPPRVAVQQTSRAIWAVFGVAAAGVMIPGVVAALSASHRANRLAGQLHDQPAAAKPQEPTYRDWNSQHPYFADVDGDGKPDPIGIVRYVSNRDEMHLAAHSSRDGKLLWETPSLGTYTDTYRAEIVVTDGTIVWGSESSQRMIGFDVRTGKKTWEVTPQEGVERFCRAQDAEHVELKDRTLWKIDLGTGALAKQTKQLPCKSHKVEGSAGGDLWNVHVEGINLERSYAVPEGWLASAAKYPGTAIPMLVSLDKKTKERWRATIPPVDPMQASHSPFTELSFDDTQIVVAATYEDKKPPRIEVFDRQTGDRKLDVPLAVGPDNYMRDVPLTLQGDTIYAVVSARLQAYDRQTGKQRWQLH